MTTVRNEFTTISQVARHLRVDLRERPDLCLCTHQSKRILIFVAYTVKKFYIKSVLQMVYLFFFINLAQDSYVKKYNKYVEK